MTIKKTNLKYFLLPLISALFIVSLITLILFTFFNGNKALVDTKLSYITPSSLNDFDSIKKVNEISYLMNNYDYVYDSFADVLKTSDGYIFTKTQIDSGFFNTYIVKMNFSGEEIWSYKYEFPSGNYRYNMVFKDEKVYFTSSDYGVLILNANDGSVYKYNKEFNYFDIQIYNNNLMMINHKEVVIVDKELNVIKTIKTDSLSDENYKIYFDDFYISNDYIYVLATKEFISDGSFSPIIFTLDDNLSFVEDLPVQFDNDNDYLLENGHYREYYNFVKDDKYFYQVGYDFHRIDANGIDTLLVDCDLFKNNQYDGVVDILEFDNFYITLDVEYNTTDGDINLIDSHTYLNVRNKDFDIVRQYKVNDNFVQFFSEPESMNYVDGKIVVKWYDWATYEFYISEFEFDYESEKCIVISGTGSDIGDEIKCGQEEFYVVENDGVNVQMMSKYNLLVGDNYERFILDEPFVAADMDEMYTYLLGLQSFRDKLTDGFVINNVLYDDNTDDGSYILYEVQISKSLDYKTGTVICDKKISNCTDDELLLLAKEQGYFGKNTYYRISDIGEDDGFAIIEFIPDDYYSYYIFDEPVGTIKEALLNKDVQDILSSDYNYYFITLEDGTIFGLEFFRNNYSHYLFLDESFATERELLNNPEVVKYLQSGYSFMDSVTDDNGLFFGVEFEYVFKDRKSFIFENDYSSVNELMKSDEMSEYLDKGYLYIYYIRDSNGNYIGAEFDKYDDITFKTILFDTTVSCSLIDLYNREDVQELLEQGYMLYDTETVNTSFSCGQNVYCKYNYSGVVLAKYDMYNFLTIIVDDHSTSTTDIFNNELVQEKLLQGYEFEEYLGSSYRSYIVNDNGTASSSTQYYYFGIVLRERIGDGVIVDDYTPSYIMEKIHPIVVRQDETALGAHGGSTGEPEPFEIGVLDSMKIWGWGVSEIYSDAYVDYEYSVDYPVYRYYHSYYSTLKNDGFNALDVDSISVSEINSIVKEVSNSELPLDEWYSNMDMNENYDYVTGGTYYILGSIKEHVSDDYNWLWNTTYWVSTYIPSSDYSVGDSLNGYILFVDTLGDLCSSHFCAVAIGAGLRPVVTMSVSSIDFNVYTEDDGNGKVVASSNTAIKGDTITFEVTPNDGYVLKEVVVTDELGNSITFDEYKFTMPSADVTISAKFEKIILIEPTISIEPVKDKNNVLGEDVQFIVTITNPYDFPLTDMTVTSDSAESYCYSKCSVSDDNIVTIPVLEANGKVSYALYYPATETGIIPASVEILTANAVSPYFFNHEEPYVANTEASTIALVHVCNVLDGEGNGGVNQYNLYSYSDEGFLEFDYWFTLKDNTCVTLALETDITYNLYQLDRQEYEFVSVDGLITFNDGSFILEPKEYDITFNNKYLKKNYFHSWNRVENDVDMNLNPS